MINLGDIEKARARISSSIKKTPCLLSPQLSEICGAQVFLKLENFQRTGSFKERGALNKLLCLKPDEKERGVIAASAGNHAQGVAYHSSRLGLDAIIVMPETTPLVKVQSTRRYGAQVVLFGSNYDEACKEALRLQSEQDLTFIHPFDDDDIIAGQGTIGLEVLEQVPDLDAIVVPIGGGGLIGGIATAIKESQPKVRVLGVQAARSPSMVRSLETGHPITIRGSRSLADGIQVKRPGNRTFSLVERYVDQVRTVSESELADTIIFLLEEQKTLAEGAGAAGIAALLKGHFPELQDQKVVSLLCGGNIDLTLLNLIIDRSMVRAGRLVRFSIRIQHKPGALAEMLKIIADLEANVTQIDHHRTFTNSPFWQAEVLVTLETRDSAHAELARSALEEHGYQVRDSAWKES